MDEVIKTIEERVCTKIRNCYKISIKKSNHRYYINLNFYFMIAGTKNNSFHR